MIRDVASRRAVGVVLLTVFFATWAPAAGAFPFGPGGARILPDPGVYVHGVRVRDPSAVIQVPTDRPTFHGVTVPGVRVTLSTAVGIELGATWADPRGAWIIRAPSRPLPPGRHDLQMELEDEAGVSTGPRAVAALEVPREVHDGAVVTRTPPVSLVEWNDVTVSGLVFATSAVFLVVYLLLRRRETL